MDPCAAQLGAEVLPHCEAAQHAPQCCASLRRPAGCAPAWAHAFDVHAARARVRFGCADEGAWCDECRHAECETLAWKGEMTPPCAAAVRARCASPEECRSAARVASVCGDRTPRWRDCAARVRARETSLAEIAAANRSAARFGIVRLSPEAWEFTETFGCGAHPCVAVVATRAGLARAAFAQTSQPLALADRPTVAAAVANVVIIVLLACTLAILDGSRR